MKVRDVMTVNPKSCEAGANLAQAAAMMWEGIPVGSIGPTRARCIEKARRIFEDQGWV